MDSILDTTTRNSVIERIGKLNAGSTAQWGKMNISQMIKHCSLFEDLAFGTIQYKQSFIGKIFGKMALKGMLKDDAPMKKSMPTLPDFKIKETTSDIEADRTKWIEKVKRYDHYTSESIVHPFFGRMLREEVGRLAYKHVDHHLRQFNV